MLKASIIFFCLALSFCRSPAQVSPCLVSKGLVNTTGCKVVATASVYPGHCIAFMQSKIARSANAENLVSWNVPATCWGWLPDKGAAYNDKVLPPPSAQVNCTAPYDKCWSHYCPETYCDIIRSLVDIKAGLIARAVNTWSQSGSLHPGTAYYRSMKQLVTDINAAYDCAGLVRPIIQGSIFEHIDEDVAQNPIPPEIITEFSGMFTPGETSYYMHDNGTPRSLNFSFRNIVFTEFPGNSHFDHCPDMAKTEAMMWFYYLSKMYIDLGYTSIHMGQMQIWGHRDTDLSRTTLVLKKIRDYATRQQTFILLTEENFKAKKFPGTDTFMFDYDSRSMRLREISEPQVSGENDCDTPPSYLLENTPCAGAYPAILDECVLQHSSCNPGNSGGYSPVYPCYLPNMPYNTYFDFGPGDTPPIDEATPGANCENNEGISSTWGYDDAKWFGWRTDRVCRKYWLGDAICRIRKYNQPGLNFSMGFMIAPNILNILMPTQRVDYLSGSNPTADQTYLMLNEPEVLQAVSDLWKPGQQPKVTLHKDCIEPAVLCADTPTHYAPRSSYIFSLHNPDCTSIYSWHIQDPDGTWQDFQYGNDRTFLPTASGVYRLYLRQDNTGFTKDPEQGYKVYPYLILLASNCCETGDPDLTGEVELLPATDPVAIKLFKEYLNRGIPYYLK